MNNFPSYHAAVTVTEDVVTALSQLISEYPEDKVFLVSESNTTRFCLPVLQNVKNWEFIQKTEIPAGEENKKLASVEKIWSFLSENGADRKSLVINVGGGMLTDLGSFAASTYKRGMDFVNIPTTLLSQVDASVGGKTGFNFNGFKNEIGVINQPKKVIIDTRFLKTIDRQNFISGFAEMVKHGLIHSEDHLKDVRNYDLDLLNYEVLSGLIANSVAIKDYFVDKDPTEKNIRKALNFGHTIGHAFESYAMAAGNPILHGYAVAYGMIAELYLSHKVTGLSRRDLEELSEWLLSIYGKFEIRSEDYQPLLSLMSHDKKNEGNRINFTLLPKIGKVTINQDCSRELIIESLEFYQNLSL